MRKVTYPNNSLTKGTQRRKEENLIKVRTFTLKEIYLELDVIHVMKRDTLLKIVRRARTTLTRIRGAKEDIMPTLQRMMNHPRRDPDMKVKTLQAKMNMF